jgi:hypothetical protein
VTTWSQVFLGVIAIATLATAIVQVGVLVAAGLVVLRVGRLLEKVERELQPAFAQVNAIGRDAARAVSLAAAQVERADKLFTDVTRRIDETLSVVQSTIVAPAREGKAVLSALRAALDVLREARRHRRSHRAEEEDALFI